MNVSKGTQYNLKMISGSKDSDGPREPNSSKAAKRRRPGRPKSFANEAKLATEAGIDVVAQDAATDRRVGRMSLR